jgi:hypothetical protein
MDSDCIAAMSIERPLREQAIPDHSTRASRDEGHVKDMALLSILLAIA